MIFVDSSVWIDFFRGGSETVAHLGQLLDDDDVALPVPVWIELLSGASDRDLGRLRKLLSALPRYYPRKPTWDLMEKWLRQSHKKGQRFNSVDLLIAAIAAENGGVLWSFDKAFARMAALKLIRVY